MRTANPLRVKMISMMYLVLIAMWVLNPELEFIDHFTDLNRSLERTNERLNQKTQRTLLAIKNFMKLDSTKYTEMYSRVNQAKNISDRTVDYIEDIKLNLIKEAGGYDAETRHLKKIRNPTISTIAMYRNLPEEGHSLAEELKDSLENAKEQLLEIINYQNKLLLDTVLVLDDELKKYSGIPYSWDKYYFYNVPLGAVIAILSKFQNDVRVAESLIVKNFYDQVQGEGGFWNVQFAARDTTRIDTVFLEGDVVTHDVFTVGQDGNVQIRLPVDAGTVAGSDAQIYIYGDNGEVIDSARFNNGIGSIKVKTDQIGEFEIKGYVRMRYDFDDEPIQADKESFDQPPKEERIPFEYNYQVESRPYVSQKDFNVLYIGVNNPINVFEPNYSFNDYKVTISQGKIINNGRDFYANVNRKGFAKVTLYVPDGEGGWKYVADETFKVKELPKPTVKVYNQTGGTMSAKIFKQQKGLKTDLTNLEIDANYTVAEYTVTYVNNNGLGVFREKIRGSYFSGKSRELIDLAQPGDIYIFEDIIVKGPDGLNKKVDPLVFNIL